MNVDDGKCLMIVGDDVSFRPSKQFIMANGMINSWCVMVGNG